MIHEGDTVFHLGDLFAGVGSHPGGWKLAKEIMLNLKGNKVLIRGNHDHKSDQFYFDEFYIDEVCDYVVLDHFFLCHYPLGARKYRKESKKTIKFKKWLFQKFKEEKCKYVIHGHTHIQEKFFPNHYNVSVDMHDYCPSDFDDIKRFLYK